MCLLERENELVDMMREWLQRVDICPTGEQCCVIFALITRIIVVEPAYMPKAPDVIVEMTLVMTLGIPIVDSSIMPTIVHEHTNVPSIMIAEKGVDLIARHV